MSCSLHKVFLWVGTAKVPFFLLLLNWMKMDEWDDTHTVELEF